MYMNRFNKLALWMLREMRFEVSYGEPMGLPIWLVYDQKRRRYISFSENKIIVGHEFILTETGSKEIETLKKYLIDERDNDRKNSS